MPYNPSRGLFHDPSFSETLDDFCLSIEWLFLTCIENNSAPKFSNH